MTLDRAGWHTTGDKLKVPDNTGLPALPPYSPGLNPPDGQWVENIWQYLRQHHLANRVFDTCHAIVDACCKASLSDPLAVCLQTANRVLDASIACRALDARMPAQMGAAPALEPDVPLSQSQRDIWELKVARLALVKDKTCPKNRLQTPTLAFTLKQANARLTLILRKLSELANTLIKTDREWARKAARSRRIL